MQNKFSIQIRRYRVNGQYSRTVEFKKLDCEQARTFFNAWIVKHTHHELQRDLQTTPLNIMIRRDGKLISYKELV